MTGRIAPGAVENAEAYGHVVIRGDNQPLSLFAERAERGALPDAPTTALAGDMPGVHATTQFGYRISAAATGDHRLFLVPERPTDPADVAQVILRSAAPSFAASRRRLAAVDSES